MVTFLLAVIPTPVYAQEIKKLRWHVSHGAGPMVLSGSSEIKGLKTVLGGQVMVAGMYHMKYLQFGLGFDNMMASGNKTTVERTHPRDTTVLLREDAVQNIHRFVPMIIANVELPLHKQWRVFAGGYTGPGIGTGFIAVGTVTPVSCLRIGVVVPLWKYLELELSESYRYTRVNGAQYLSANQPRAIVQAVPMSPFNVHSFTTCFGIRTRTYRD